MRIPTLSLPDNATGVLYVVVVRQRSLELTNYDEEVVVTEWSAERIQDPVYRTKFVGVTDIIADWVASYGGLGGRDVLDFGCGEATMALGIALRYGARRCVGVEIHSEIDNAIPYAAAQLGLNHLPRNLELIKVEADSPLTPLGTFDVVYTWSVFEHVRQDLIVECLQKLRQVLRPGGVMFLQTTPLYYSAEGSHFKPWIPEPWAHLSMQQDLFYEALRSATDGPQQAVDLIGVYEGLNRMTARQLIRAVQQAGFEVLREYRTYDDLPIPDHLLEVYTKEALTTQQVVLLAGHANEPRSDPPKSVAG